MNLNISEELEAQFRSLPRDERSTIMASLKRLVETELGRLLEEGGGKSMTHWEFPDSPIGKQNGNGIRHWLFRRR